jgi:hypothetical protein
MTDTNQPEALRLAEMIEGDMSCIGDAEIATELRRLHEENETLKKCLFQMQNAAIELAKPEQALICPKCNADRTKEDCKGEKLQCGVMGQAQLAKPEQVTVSFPSFMRKRIEQAMKDAIHPQGMSVHNGKINVLASDLHRMLLAIDTAPPRKEWVGLTDDEIWECQKPGLLDDVYKLIEAKLKEKNNGN